MKGSPETSDSTGWGLAVDSKAVCVSVDYRLAPEHKHPELFDDCYGVVAHIAENAAALGIDPARIAVSGDSAGGCLTAAVCLAARDRGGPTIAAQVLIYPCLTDDTLRPLVQLQRQSARPHHRQHEAVLGVVSDELPSKDPYATPALRHRPIPPATNLCGHGRVRPALQ